VGVDLTCCRQGACARILGLDIEPGICLRLCELGLRPGALVEVTHGTGRQGRVVALGAERFALDARTCARIAVELVGPDCPLCRADLPGPRAPESRELAAV